MKLNENYIIQKSLPLLQEIRNSRLSLLDLKMIEVYLSKINSHKPQERTVVFTRKDLQEVFGKMVDVSSLRKSIETIQNLQVSEILTNGSRNTERKISLFEMSEMEYDENGIQQITLKSSESAMQYIFNIEELRYLRYKLRNVVHLTSKYSYHLFLYLIENKFQSQWNVSVSELLELLNSPYDDYTNFNKHILKPCMTEINKKTSLKCDYTAIRRGLDRATKEIIFIIDSWGELEKVLQEPEHPMIETAFSELQTPSVPDETSEELDERTSLFMDCFNNEFTSAQVQLILSAINPDAVKDSQYGRDIAKYDYLDYMYKRLKAEEEYRPISNRFKYFVSMIKNDKGGDIL